MSTRYPPTFPPDTASSWRRIRRYAVPGWMIERATALRVAGDWQGACAAANVDVEFSLADIAHQHGAQVAIALEDDLRYLAPDLLRWHLPRYLRGRTTLRPRHTVALAGYGAEPADGPYLQVILPGMADGPQRLTLRVGHFDRDDRPWFSRSTWATARHLWDARNAADLRERCGGADRAPFHNADGSRSKLPAADPGPGDLAGRTEWATVLHDRGTSRAHAVWLKSTWTRPRRGCNMVPRPRSYRRWRSTPEAVAWAGGAVDYTYRRPSRRSAALRGVVLPSLRRPLPVVAIVIDTSGSMGEDDLAMALAEVTGVLRAVGVGGNRIAVLACDADVHAMSRVTSVAQVTLAGGGGTDMRAGIERALALPERPGVVIVITDGFTPWPAQPVSRRLIAVLTFAEAPSPPGWAETVRIT